MQLSAVVPRVAGVCSPAGQNVWTKEQEGKETAAVHQECDTASQVWRTEHAKGIHESVCVCFSSATMNELSLCLFIPLQKEAEAYQAKVCLKLCNYQVNGRIVWGLQVYSSSLYSQNLNIDYSATSFSGLLWMMPTCGYRISEIVRIT